MESCTNYELQLLVDKLNSSNITSRGIGYNKLEILYDDTTKDIVFNLLSTIKNNKIGYSFSVLRKNDLSIKSVIINFSSKININVEYLTKILNNKTYIDTTNYTIINNIIDKYSQDYIEFSIQDNLEYKNNYLITISEILPKEDINNNNTYVVKKNLTKNIIHTIVKPVQNNKYKITYRLLYSNINELTNLLTDKPKTKKLHNDQVISL